jgi:PleD family two-component response regulator
LRSTTNSPVHTPHNSKFPPTSTSAQREKVAGFSPPNETLGKTILLADDDTALRVLVKNVLVNEGYRVVLARDGQSVFDLTNEVPVDLILLDVNMPDRNGWDRTSHLRK